MRRCIQALLPLLLVATAAAQCSM